jgi:hypothetical protein
LINDAEKSGEKKNALWAARNVRHKITNINAFSSGILKRQNINTLGRSA